MNFYHWNVAAPWYTIAMMFVPVYWGLAQIIVPRFRGKNWNPVHTKLLVYFWTLGGIVLLFYWSAQTNMAEYFDAQAREVKASALSRQTSDRDHCHP